MLKLMSLELGVRGVGLDRPPLSHKSYPPALSQSPV